MSFTIGNLAKQAAVTIETIRYYQRIGLLKEPDKPRSGYRQAIARIRFIKRAQHVGFNLKEMSLSMPVIRRLCAGKNFNYV